MSTGAKKRANGLLDALIDHWWVDLVVATAASAGVALVAHYAPSLDLLARLTLEERRASYGDFMQLSNTMAAGIGVAFTVYIAMTSRGVEQVKHVLGSRLLRMWMWAFVAPWLASGLLMVLRAVDAGAQAPSNWVHHAAVGAALMVIAACSRVLYVFYALADLQHQPARPTMATASRGIGMREPARAGGRR